MTTHTNSRAASGKEPLIALGLAGDPALLIADEPTTGLDEPVSALDASVAAQIVNLLLRLRKDLNLALLFITHNLRLVRHLTTRVAVMRTGRIVESASTVALFASPHHPYTHELLSTAGLSKERLTDPDREQTRTGVDAEDGDNRVLPLREVTPAH